jgi:hypothetical protein
MWHLLDFDLIILTSLDPSYSLKITLLLKYSTIIEWFIGIQTFQVAHLMSCSYPKLSLFHVPLLQSKVVEILKRTCTI